MADISIIHKGSTDYNVKDAAARLALAEQVDNGAKNVLYYTKVGTSVESGSQYLSNGVRFTLQSDSSILVNRESSNANEAFCNLRLNSSSQFIDDFCNGQYVLSGSYVDCILRATNNTYNAIDTGNGVVLQDRGAQTSIWVQIRVSASASPNNVTVKPMICTKAEWDISHTYVPYGKTNAELTNDTSTLFTENTRQETEIGVVANAGAKNFASKNSGSGTNSTAIPKTPITLPVGDYICSFSASSYSGNAAFELWDASNSQQYVKELTVAGSNSFKFTVTGAMSVAKYSLYVNNATISDFMIRSAAITDTSYQPYARTNPALTAEMDYVVNAGAKNLLKIDKSQIKSSSWNTDWTWSGDTASNGNASITINQDNTFTVAVSNTMTAQVIFDIYLSNDDVSNVILSGCPSGGSSSTHFMYVKGTSYYDTGNGVTFSKTGPFRIAIVVASGHAAGTYIFKPMIRPAAITDPTFQPYARTNRELTVLTDEDRAAIVELVDNGAKNFIRIMFTSIAATSTTPSVTNNGDGSITINGTRTGANYIPVYDLESDITSSLSTRYTLPTGKYVATTINHTRVTLQVYMHDGTNIVSIAQAASKDIEFEYTETDKQNYPYICFRLYISGSSSGITYDNEKIYPMVCTKAAWDISHAYQPYRPSWQEMEDNNKTIDISSQITAESGYTVESTTHLYYQNKLVFGTIAIAINSGSYSSSLTSIAKLPVEYAPARQYLGSCGFSTSQWGITNVGYAFIQAANASSTAQRGQISVKSPTANLTHMILNVCYPTAT